MACLEPTPVDDEEQDVKFAWHEYTRPREEGFYQSEKEENEEYDARTAILDSDDATMETSLDGARCFEERLMRDATAATRDAERLDREMRRRRRQARRERRSITPTPPLYRRRAAEEAGHASLPGPRGLASLDPSYRPWEDEL